MVPNPAAFSEKSLRDPRARAELHAWAGRLHVDDGALRDFAIEGADAIRAVRAFVRAPFAPYLAALGVHQTWSLFTVAVRKNVKLVIEARDCPVDDDRCAWRALYRTQDENARWASEQLESDRTVGSVARFSYPENKPARAVACKVLARRAFAELSSVQAVRCNLETFASPDPTHPAPPHQPALEHVDEGKPITRAAAATAVTR